MGESQVADNRSKQDTVVTGTGKPMTPIQPIANYWNFTNGDISPDYFDNAKIYDLIVTPNAGMYWLSSRYAYRHIGNRLVLRNDVDLGSRSRDE